VVKIWPAEKRITEKKKKNKRGAEKQRANTQKKKTKLKLSAEAKKHMKKNCGRSVRNLGGTTVSTQG